MSAPAIPPRAPAQVPVSAAAQYASNPGSYKSTKPARPPSLADPPVVHAKYFEVKLGRATPLGFFTQVSGVSAQMETMDYPEGGRNDFIHRLPGRIKQGNLTLKHGIVKNEIVLFEWSQKALGSIEIADLSINVYDYDGDILQTWSFRRAYPIKWTASDLNAGGSEFLTQSLEIAHSGMTVKAGSNS
jgi:phage tail-like protein